jgi:hypothetical protein
VKVNVLSHCLLRAGMDSGRLERERERERSMRKREQSGFISTGMSWIYYYQSK